MYNGIGLTTPRGSGTSGHVVKNVSYLKPEFFRNKVDSNTGRQNSNSQTQGLISGQSNKEILDHNKKREIESKLYELQENMIDQGYSDAEIEVKLAEARKVQNNKASSASSRVSKSLNDSHVRESVKREENLRIRSAFGIKSNFVEGDSFNEEKIASQKAERINDREERDKQKKEVDQKPQLGRERSEDIRSRRDRSRDRDVRRRSRSRDGDSRRRR